MAVVEVRHGCTSEDPRLLHALVEQTEIVAAANRASEA